MPTYQYTCTSCAEPLEVVQKFSDDPLSECPKCAGRLRKVFSPVGVVFKGSGFYRNDSRSSSSSSGSAAAKNGEAKNGEAKNGEAKAADSGSNGSDSKSDTKTPAASSTTSSSSSS